MGKPARVHSFHAGYAAPVGDAEVERGHHAAGADRAGQFGQRGRGIVDVAQQVGVGERVHGAVLQRQRLGLCLDQVDDRVEPCGRHPLACAGEHLGALVDARDMGAVALRDCHRDRAGAGGHVGHMRPGRGHRGSQLVDQALVPAGVLAEAEQARPPVVVLGDAGEQVAGMQLALALGGHSNSPSWRSTETESE